MRKTHYIPITADIEGAADKRTCALIRRTIRTALAAEGTTPPCEADALRTDDAGLHRINLDMRNVDRPTDVLSFPEFDLTPEELPAAEDADPGTGLIPLGDMVLSMERVAAQAEEYGHSRQRELAYLVTHSMLHLLGYDHLYEGGMKKQMRGREEAIMALLGLEREERRRRTGNGSLQKGRGRKDGAMKKKTIVLLSLAAIIPAAALYARRIFWSGTTTSWDITE